MATSELCVELPNPYFSHILSPKFFLIWDEAEPLWKMDFCANEARCSKAHTTFEISNSETCSAYD